MKTASTADSDTTPAEPLVRDYDLPPDIRADLIRAQRRYFAGRGRRRLQTRLSRRPLRAASQGHERRTGDNTRARGSKRTTGSGTTSSGEDSDPELQPRRCKACGADISHLLKPGPGRPRTHCEDPDCKRTRNRAYVRKHRGPQWVLVKWTKASELAGSERHTHVEDTGPRERTHSIVDLDLARERDPQDAAQARLEKLVTDFLIVSRDDQPIPREAAA